MGFSCLCLIVVGLQFLQVFAGVMVGVGVEWFSLMFLMI